ncbi:Clavaminate synthase-like protein [Lentinula edodes]|uniref:Clavaminate synthase-like protein n=1 Tax=Lentinula edodes TaxID=5353 RepID=UPI001E8ED9CD|nr:Clavaminate synthase-like protein [Lentinula edodes]KAH7878913.1 Clavaminate synthase-like protein [Lentinula edodes]
MPVPVRELPEWPSNVEAHPLLVIDYQLLKAGDETEINRLWEAGTNLGFWYLKNHGAEQDFVAMWGMGEEVFKLPLEEKMKYEQGDEGLSFGYKAVGHYIVDAAGNPDPVEGVNVAKDDALSYPKVSRREYPTVINDLMDPIVTPFVEKCVDISNTMIGIFNDKLGLPEGALAKLHGRNDFSASETRTIKAPANLTPGKLAIGGHTDFGTLSLLVNNLGGLQVLPPGNTEWSYVRPLPGHMICNVGDTLTMFSGGLLNSNIHRVVPPPGSQSKHDRWSQVYFTRPADNAPLLPLLESPIISEAFNKLSPERQASLSPGVTSWDWFTRRQKNYRTKNHKGADTWAANRGTEHGRA